MVAKIYTGIKEDEASKLVQDDTVKLFSKEIAAHILSDVLNCSFFDLENKNIILCQRHLLAYHAKKAYELKINEKRNQIIEQRKR
jgi:hypothetical protein